MPIFYSAMLLTGVNLLLRLVSTSFQVFVSGKLGASGVGLLQLVMSVGTLAMTAGTAGVRTATMYLTAEALGKKRAQNVYAVLRGAFVYSVLCSGAVAALLYFAAPTLARSWIGDTRTIGAIRLYACFLPVVCLCGCMTGYFTAANRIGTLAAVEIAEQLCSMAVTMCALLFWAGSDPGRACESVVLGGGVGACLTLICLILLRLLERARRASGVRVARRLLGIALPLALADDLKSGISTAENLMVPKRLALYPGTADAPLAAFGMVCGMVFPVLMFPAAILFSLAELLIPELARCAAAGSRARIRYLARRSLRVAMLYGFLCAGLLFLLARPLCVRLYRSEEAGRYLQLYAMLAPMLYCDAVTDAMTKGLGQQNKCVRYNIITSAMDVTLLFFLLPRFGMGGYFVSFLISHAVNFLLSIRLLLKITGNRIPLHIPTLTAAVTVCAVWAASGIASAVLRAAAFAAAYGSMLFLLKIVGKEDLLWLKGLFRPAKNAARQ